MGRWGRVGALVSLMALLGGLAACSDDGDEPDAKPKDEPSDVDAVRDELIEMFDADQAERSGEVPMSTTGDSDRANRLKEIIEEHGWPTIDLVGKEGATAAWTIAQHSDHDVDFQKEALALMQEALEEEQVDSTEVAYLVDRVATNEGRPQTYGTQGGCVDGKASAGPIEDEANVDARREEAGLQPLAQYLEEFSAVCAEELPSG